MFDIKQAIVASFKEHKDAGRRLHLLRFLTRAANGTGYVTQWRSIGREYEIIDLFLRTAGLTEEDYQIHQSELDSEVRDFRWASLSSAYSNLSAELHCTWFLAVLSVLTQSVFLKPASYVPPMELLTNPLETPATAEHESTTFRVEEVTKSRLNDFIKAVENDPNPSQQIVDAKAFAMSNDAAVPNLALIETIVKYLGLLPDTPCKFSQHDFVTATHYKTVVRHVDAHTKCPTKVVLASVLPPFEYEMEERGGVELGAVMRRFFYRTYEASAKASNRPGYDLVSAFEVLDRDKEAHILAETTRNPKEFWTYVGTLYAAFFGCYVTLSGISRIGINPRHHKWIDLTAATSMNDCVRKLASMGFANLHDNLGVSVTLVLSEKAPVGETPLASSGLANKVYLIEAIPAPTVKVRLIDEAEPVSMESVEPYSIRDVDLAHEWYSLVHCNGRNLQSGDDISEYWGSRVYADPARISELRSRANSRVPYSAATIKKNLNPEVNPFFAVKIDNAGRMLNTNPMAALIAGVGATLQYGYSPCTFASWPIAQDQDPYADAHGTSTIVAAVYSGIPGDSTYMSQIYDEEVMSSPEKFTEFIKYLPSHQFDKASYKDEERTIILETNIVRSASTVDSLLRRSVRDIAFLSLAFHRADPRVALCRRTDVEDASPRQDSSQTRSEQYNLCSMYERIAQTCDHRATDKWIPVRTSGLEIRNTLRLLGYSLPSSVRSDTGSATWRANSTEWANFVDYHVKVCFRNDIAGRLYVVITLDKSVSLMTLLQFRIARSLPLFDTKMCAKIMNTLDGSRVLSGGTAPHGTPEYEAEAFSQVLQHVIGTTGVMDYGISRSDHLCPYAYGPWIKAQRESDVRAMTISDYRDTFSPQEITLTAENGLIPCGWFG